MVNIRKKMFSLYLTEFSATNTPSYLSFDKVNNQWIIVFFKIILPLPRNGHETVNKNVYISVPQRIRIFVFVY